MKRKIKLIKNRLKIKRKTCLKDLNKTKKSWSPRIEILLESPYIHPLLLSVYPILFLYSHNITELLLTVLVFPLILSILTTIFIFGLFYLVTRNTSASALTTSVLIILFFSFSLLRQIFINHFKDVTPNKETAVLCLVLFVVAIVSIYKQRKTLVNITKFLNFASISLSIFVLFNIISYEVGVRNKLNFGNKPQEESQFPESQKHFENRDIYYIILDAYGRQDILSDSYNFDNTDFIKYLENKGFYVASKSSSNYAYTHLSLPSTFNFKYLDCLTDQFGTERKEIDPKLSDMFHQNEAGRYLKSLGYQFINFDSGWWFTQNVPSADVNIHEGKFFSLFGITINLNDFYSVLINTTALSPFFKERLTDQARDRVLSNFAKLAELPYQRGNKFVLAHFVLPHPPWLFNENGKPVIEEEPSGFDKKLYINQLKFTNKMVQTMVDKILTRSNPKPIIIIASDHGPLIPDLHFEMNKVTNEMIKQRMSNLGAYYFPAGGESLLYDSITLVNAFRILFNYYFGTSHEILEDKNYYSSTVSYYEFHDVTDQLNN